MQRYFIKRKYRNQREEKAAPQELDAIGKINPVERIQKNQEPSSIGKYGKEQNRGGIERGDSRRGGKG